MKVICINNVNLINLKINEIYDVIKYSKKRYLIEYHDIFGYKKESWFSSNRFIDATKIIRKNKIEELLNLNKNY